MTFEMKTTSSNIEKVHGQKRYNEPQFKEYVNIGFVTNSMHANDGKLWSFRAKRNIQNDMNRKRD